MNTFTLILALMNLNNVQVNNVYDIDGFTTEKECQEVASKWLVAAKEKYGSEYVFSAVCIESTE